MRPTATVEELLVDLVIRRVLFVAPVRVKPSQKHASILQLVTLLVHRFCNGGVLV